MITVETNEDYNKLQSWYKSFASNHDGRYDLTKELWEKAEQSHQKIRKFIGGLRRIEEINLEAAVGPANEKQGMEVLNKINNIMSKDSIYGGSLEEYLEGEEFPMELGDLLNPTVMLGSHDGVKTTKYLMGIKEMACSSERKKDWDKLVAKMGKLYSNAKTVPAKYKMNLSTAAKAFLLIGHYTIDEDSCFGQGGCNQSDKTRLATAKDTYVISIKENDKYVARCWGFANDDYKTWNICNLYLGKGVRDANILMALKQYFATIMEVSPTRVFMHEDKISINGNVYLNEWANYSFSTKHDIDNQVLHAGSADYGDGEDDVDDVEDWDDDDVDDVEDWDDDDGDWE